MNDDNRYVIYPIKHNDIWTMYKKHVASFWSVEEIDLSDDLVDWKKLTHNEQHFITQVLAFFSSSDGIVNENLVFNFYKEIPCAEVRAFYSIQIFMETIHSETYSLMIDTIVQDQEQKDILFDAIEQIPSVGKKTSWALKWLNCSAPLEQRLVAFACVEGIFFSGSFCAIFWLKKRGLMPGLTFSNELISRDEGLHTDFACLLYKKLKPLDEETIHSIVKEAVEIEDYFICSALPCSLVGMNCDTMKQYIHFVADRLCTQLDCKPIYNEVNPFDWMELISMQGKTNFFEKRVSEYSKANVMSGNNGNNQLFSLKEDF